MTRLIELSYTNALGVNQGGFASDLLFSKYMSDLRSFLSSEYSIRIVSLSDSEKGMRNPLDGLLKLCSLSLMSVNEIKTNLLVRRKDNYRINLQLIKLLLNKSTNTNVLVSLFGQ